MAAVIPDVPPTGSGAGNLPVIILMDAKAFEDFKLELEALKRIGHEARKNAEMEKHKNPKTKRAIGFILDVSFCLEDTEKHAAKIDDCHIEGKPIDTVSLCDLLNNIKAMKELLNNEL